MLFSLNRDGATGLGADIQGFNVFFGNVHGVQPIGLKASQYLDSSPSNGPEAMTWADIRGASH